MMRDTQARPDGRCIFARKTIVEAASALFALGVLLGADAAPADASEAVLYTFGSMHADGANPSADLISDAAGNLYGTTEKGGDRRANGGRGTVFMLSPPQGQSQTWTETVLYNFGTNKKDGRNPLHRLVMDRKGALYGTTPFGGGFNGGRGVVFKLTPPAAQGGVWTEEVLYRFCPTGFLCLDGEEPNGPITVGAGGILYGTTTGGGLAHAGTVFALLPPAKKNRPW